MDGEDGICEEIFYWKKNCRPTIERDRVHNKCLYIMDTLKKNTFVLKTYHVSDGEGCWTEEEQNEYESGVLQCDISPYLVYSMNKKERWNINEDISYDMLINLQSLHPDMDVVVLDRSYLNYYLWLGFPFFLARIGIKTVHRLVTYQSGNDVYMRRTTKGLKQSYSTLIQAKKNKDDGVKMAEKTIVAYNIFNRVPSYEKIISRRFKTGGIKYDHKQKSRAKKMNRIYEDVREYYNNEEYDNDNTDDIDDNGLIMDINEYGYNRVYNFDDHFVEYFVFVNNY